MSELNEIILSEYGMASSVPSPVNRMMAAFSADFRDGIDINLGVGYVNEKTIPEQSIVDAMQAVIDDPDKYRQSLNYGGPQGSANLIESIREFHVRHNIGGLSREILDRKEIMIGPNGATSLLDGIAEVLEPGIVITSDPMYYIYCNYLERKGFEVVSIPEDEKGIKPDDLASTLAELGSRRAEIRFVYIVTVNNPSCSILSNERRREIVEIVTRLCNEVGRKIPLIFDKAYELLIHDPAVPAPESALLSDSLGIVYEIGTLSKILAPALRIGYMIGEDGPFMNAMIQKTSDAGFSAPLVTQETASYLLDHHVKEQIDLVNHGYREKAIKVRGWIDEYIGEYLSSCIGGQAGFYFYMTFKEIRTTEDSPFFHYLTRTTGNESIDESGGVSNPKVIYIPGEFCVHPGGSIVEKGKRQLRLSYAFEQLERIEDALKFMRDAVQFALASDSKEILR